MSSAHTDRLHANASEAETFSLFAGDALHRAQQAIGLIPRSGGFGLVRRIPFAVAVTWLPLVLYAVRQQRLLPGTVLEPLLQHFGSHARFLVALPLLIVAESTMQASLRRVLPQFLSRGLVGDASRPALQAILERTQQMRRSSG